MKKQFGLALIAALTLASPLIASATVVDYTTIADGASASVSLGGTTVTGSSLITSQTYAGFRGLGVAGGGSSVSLDTGEFMTIDFGGLAANIALTVVDIDPPGNVTFRFEAFNGASSLGLFAFPFATTHPEIYDVSALSGGLQMTSFRIDVLAPSAPLGLQIQGVSFDRVAVVPEPTSLLLIGAGLLALM
jgi:hypothetical protein